MVDDSQTINNWRLGAVLIEKIIPRKTPHPLPSTYLLTEPKPIGVYFSLPTCLKLGVSEGRLDGFSFELSFSDLFVLFSKLTFKVTSGK